MKAPEKIETARLVLERPVESDLEGIFSRYASDPNVTRFVSWPRHTSLDHTRAFFAFSEAEWNRWPAGPYVIRSRDSETLLGGTGLAFETPPQASTGYVLAVDAWGKGFATESLEAITRIARIVGVLRLQALCHTAHRASCRVLEKTGFLKVGTLNRHTIFPNLGAGERCDVFQYARELSDE